MWALGFSGNPFRRCGGMNRSMADSIVIGGKRFRREPPRRLASSANPFSAATTRQRHEAPQGFCGGAAYGEFK
jgi:hypothetical protein